MRTGELFTVDHLQKLVEEGQYLPMGRMPKSLQFAFADCPPNAPVIQETYDGETVTYMRVPGDSGDPNELVWHAEGEESGWFATVNGDDWVATHGPACEEEDLSTIVDNGPRQYATAASLASGHFHVVVQWVDASGKAIWSLPSINLTAQSYSHAQRIAAAINGE